MVFSRSNGNTISEYGIIFALVLILAIAGLSTLGKSIFNGLGKTNSSLAGSQVKNLVTMNFDGGGGTGSKAGATGTIGGDQVGLSGDMNVTAGVNTTSTDGQQALAGQTVTTAEKMDGIVAQISNPTVKTWASQVAELSHYIGGAEGQVAGVDALTIDSSSMKGNTVYTDANAVVDINNYQQKLEQLLQNPPKNVNSTAVKQITNLGNRVLANADPFAAQVGQYSKNGSKVDNKLAAQSLNLSKGAHLTNQSYDKIVDYSTLQANTQQALSDGSATGTVQTTLQDATAINQMSK